MSVMKLIRAMNPREGEEQITEVRVLEQGMTKEDIPLEMCDELAEQLHQKLKADSTIKEIVVNPQIIRQWIVENGEQRVAIQAVALVKRRRIGPVQRALATPAVRDIVSELYSDFVFRHAEQQNEALREHAEKMLADGTQGIAMIQIPPTVEEGEDGSIRAVGHTKIGLHPRVPFGHVFEFPSERAFHAWAERGYPTEPTDPYADCRCGHSRTTHVRYTGACGLCNCAAVRGPTGPQER